MRRQSLCEAVNMNTLLWIPATLVLLNFSGTGAYHFHDNYARASTNASTRSCVDGTISCKPDCSELEICDGGALTTLYQCPEDTACDSDTLTCVYQLKCRAAAVPITCHGLGLFPDPSDCKSYHICYVNGGLSTVQTCELPTAYDPLSATCSKTEADRVCKDGPLPECKRNLDRGPQAENPNIYYICVFDSYGDLVHNLYKCPVGQIYDGSKCVIRSTELATLTSATVFHNHGAMSHASARSCVDGTLSCKTDCSELEICVNGAFTSLYTCPPDSSCDSNTLSCVYNFKCHLPADPITCHVSGSFPDPSDCQSYHSCTANEPTSTVKTCDPPTAYDPLTAKCIKTEADRICKEGPLPACKENLDRGPQTENPNIYYICVFDSNGDLVHNLYKCPVGQIYDGSKCVIRSAMSTSTPTTTTVGVSTCTAAGQFPDLSVTGCRYYIVCTADLKQYRFDCLADYHYDPKLKRCVKGAGCHTF